VGPLTIAATAGLAGSGTALQITPQGGNPVNLTRSQVQALDSSNIAFNVGTIGTLVLTGFNATSNTLSFTFTPNFANRFDHSITDPGLAEDAFTFVVTDNEGDTATNTVIFRVTDTLPTAALDVQAITENATPSVITGDVISNDTQGSDTAISVSQVSFLVNGNLQTPSVGLVTASAFGTVDINADGTYTYTLDNANSDVSALNDNESLTEIFNYTIVDTDGDTSTSTLTVTINGVTD